jgi:protein-S-isoprenylcysteine O-methyltransferase Ste14
VGRDRRYLLRHLASILLLPFNALVLIPTLILLWTRDSDPGWGFEPPLGYLPAIVGAGVVVAGLWLMYRTIALFFGVGEGTLAPWDPPRKFVVQGIYRHVRNPMMLGVLSVLLGQAILFGSPGLFAWFAFWSLCNMIYIPLLEEPVLERRFGEPYRLYRANVPRWIPRLSPWRQP